MNEKIKQKKINNVVVKPIKGCGSTFKLPVRGSDLYTLPYTNVAILAGKNSGKTTVIYNSLKKCARKGTNIMIFCPTIHQDKSYKAMAEMLESKGCNVMISEHFIDGESGINYIDEFRKNYISPDAEPDTESEPDPKDKYSCLWDHEKEPECSEAPKPYVDKYTTPETIIVLDDLANDLRHPSVVAFLIKNRHYKTKVFMACHTATNLLPASWENIDVALVFKNQSEDRIQELANKMGILLPQDRKGKSYLHRIYDSAIVEPRDFMYIQRNPHFEFRRNFNNLIEF